MTDRGRKNYFKNKKTLWDRVEKKSKRGNSDGTESAPRRHPPGLTGREIGMFYRDRQRKEGGTQKDGKMKPIPIKISDDILNELTLQLSRIRVPDIRSPFQATHSQSNYDHVKDSCFKRRFINTISSSFEDKLAGIPNDEVYLIRNREIDRRLKKEFEALNKLPANSQYKEMLEFRRKLPAFNSRKEILECLELNQVVVISGETGCGKTTQVPQFILDHFIEKGEGSLCKIVCTQPRRISAIAVAERVAAEKQSKVGCNGYSGYTIRLESKLPREVGSVLFCTTGVLIQQMQSNLPLNGISHLILDEIHERDVQIDIMLAITKQLITRRKDLKLILMSATLNAQLFSKYFNNCPCLHIPGFTYPVKELFLEEILLDVNYELPDVRNQKPKKLNKRQLKKGIGTGADQNFIDYVLPHVRELRNQGVITERIAATLSNPESEKLNPEFIFEVAVHVINTQPPGAILIFMPGIGQISALTKLMEEQQHRFLGNKVNVIPLHSKLATIEQKTIFEVSPIGVRKVIIATSIAETSITIDDVVYVINPGQIKLNRYDPVKDLDSLEAEWVTNANSFQRRGRAGRVQPGVCYHLFTKARHETMDANPMPEILRTRLDEVILQLKMLLIQRVDLFLQSTLSQPNPLSVTKSLNILRRLNALDSNEKLTPLGYHLARLPMDPRSGKMILLGALFSCLDPVLSIAASLTFKDPFNIPLSKQQQVLQVKSNLGMGTKSDHLVIAEVMRLWEDDRNNWKLCRELFLNGSTLQLLANMKKQFAEYLKELNFIPTAQIKNLNLNLNSKNTSLLRAIICAGLFPNVARMSCRKKLIKHPSQIQIHTENEKVQIAQFSVNSNEKYFEGPFLVYFTKIKSSQVYIHDCTMAHALPIILFANHIDYSLEELPADQNRNPEMILKLNELIQFKCTIRVAELIKKVAEQFNVLLEYKVAHPGFIDWNSMKSYEVDILKVIMRMVTLEDTGSLEFDD